MEANVKLRDLLAIRPGPIRHETLPAELLERIRLAYDLVGCYTHNSLEEFEIGFMRDTHPDREVGIWGLIVAAWLDYHKKHLGEPRMRSVEVMGRQGQPAWNRRG